MQRRLGRRWGAAAAATALLLTACSTATDAAPEPARPAADGAAPTSSPAPDSTEPAVEPTDAATPVDSPTDPSDEAAPTITVAERDGSVPFDRPVRISASEGSVVQAVVSSEGGKTLAGSPDSDRWVSTSPPVPGAAYDVVATVADTGGTQHEVRSSFEVAKVPDSRRLTLSILPSDREVVGVGAPISVTFDQEVTEKEAVEAALQVSSAPQVVGAWHWVNDQQVQFRPRAHWPVGTKVRAVLDLNGVRAGEDLWGGRSYDVDFNVGSARKSVIDADAHTFRVFENGKQLAKWPTSLGKPEFATRNGTYILLEKYETLNMTSCSVGITCDPGDSDFYDLKVDWNVRLTNSGAFVHAAPWSAGSQGSANVSHGCINLSTERARAFYAQAKYGDLLVVRDSSRSARDRIEAGDPGMINWNLTWAQWLAGSALGEAVRTSPLGGSAA